MNKIFKAEVWCPVTDKKLIEYKIMADSEEDAHQCLHESNVFRRDFDEYIREGKPLAVSMEEVND